MSRRDVQVTDDARWVFNRLAADFARRPGYPGALVERLAALAGGPGARVADLGAGTGLIALPLAAAGLRVDAVEPAREMLGAMERAASIPPFAPSGGPEARSRGAPTPAHSERSAAGAESRETPTPTLSETPPRPLTPSAAPAEPARSRGALPLTLHHATAEATPLPSAAFDLVLVADALHWIDPVRGGREAARLLAPGGAVAVVEPRFAGTPFMSALAALVAGANPKARPGPAPVTTFLAHACPRAAVATERIAQVTPIDDEAHLDALLRSLSLVGPALGPAPLAALLADARALAAAHGGGAWARELLVHLARVA